MAVNRATYLADELDKTLSNIARDRKWSLSKTIAELVAQHPDVIGDLRLRKINPVTFESLKKAKLSATR